MDENNNIQEQNQQQQKPEQAQQNKAGALSPSLVFATFICAMVTAALVVFCKIYGVWLSYDSSKGAETCLKVFCTLAYISAACGAAGSLYAFAKGPRKALIIVCMVICVGAFIAL